MTVDIVLSLIRAQGLLIAAMADLLEKHGIGATREITDLFETSKKAQNAFEDAIAAQEKKESSNAGRTD